MRKRLFGEVFEEHGGVLEEFSSAQTFGFLLQSYAYDSRIFVLEYLYQKAQLFKKINQPHQYSVLNNGHWSWLLVNSRTQITGSNLGSDPTPLMADERLFASGLCQAQYWTRNQQALISKSMHCQVLQVVFFSFWIPKLIKCLNARPSQSMIPLDMKIYPRGTCLEAF